IYHCFSQENTFRACFGSPSVPHKLHLNNILTHCLVGDLDSSKGQINSFGDKPGGLKMVDSLVPLAERDVGTLRGMTKACASYIG
ncbi:unnamed protein product, partial [Brassica rapa subsp. narinosa]